MAYQRSTTQRAIRTPTDRDLAWAAGFIEGEGTFVGNSHGSFTVSACQVNPEPLIFLEEIFGGKTVPSRSTTSLGYREIFYWGVYGTRARGVMMTLYSYMTHDRKQQIIRALEFAIYKSPRTHCSKGHELSGYNRMGGDGKRVRCRICHNEACLKWYHNHS